MREWMVVSPSVANSAQAATVNGNSRTAERWAWMLKAAGAGVEVRSHWQVGDTSNSINARNADNAQADAMMALHARRSASSLAAWASAHPTKPLVLVLTGTDVYRDIHTDAAAQHSLELATHLVVLQSEAVAELPPHLHAKTRVILQSAPMPAATRTRQANDPLQVLMVGHLRDEKDPATYMRAVQQLAGQPGLRFSHIGDGLDADLAALARQTEQTNPSYRYLGALPYAQTLQAIANADVLVHASRMEGGAHVIAEACCAGLAVLASRISGNVGMLGREHGGYFELGHAAQLAALLLELARHPGKLSALQQQSKQRASLFAPQLEQAAIAQLHHDCFLKAPT